MLLIVLLLSLLFTGLGFVVTEKNAKYLLAGYNTMNEAQRQQFNLKAYLRLFKRFHLFLASSFALIALLLHFLFGEVAVSVFLIVYPIVAYGWLLIKGERFSANRSTKTLVWVVLGLAVVLLFVLGLMYKGLIENKLIISKTELVIDGMYGRAISLSEIDSVALLKQLPSLAARTNGFAMGEVKKGYFKTTQGDKVLLFVSRSDESCMAIHTKNDGWIYYNVRSAPIEPLVENLRKAILPRNNAN